MARPRKYDDSIREDLIIAAASRVAAGDDFSLRSIATDCGCTTSTIYRLFADRDTLITAVVDYVSASFSKNQHNVATTDAPLDDLRRLGIAYRAWATENPTLYHVMFGGPPACAPEPVDDLPDSDSIQPLIDAVRRGLTAGELVGGRPEQIVRSIWAGVHGWVTLELGGGMPNGPRKRVREYGVHLDSLLRAWRS
ncbi:MAG: TetR-like C-terminal domain-containing protein [Cumulibacter sp.]